jgi:hypothetical protein
MDASARRSRGARRALPDECRRGRLWEPAQGSHDDGRTSPAGRTCASPQKPSALLVDARSVRRLLRGLTRQHGAQPLHRNGEHDRRADRLDHGHRDLQRSRVEDRAMRP